MKILCSILIIHLAVVSCKLTVNKPSNGPRLIERGDGEGFSKDHILRNSRRKRDAGDSSIPFDAYETPLVGDTHRTAYVEWGGAKESMSIILLTRDTALPTKDSNLYVSLDYGKSLILRNPKLANGVDEAVCTYIYKSPVNFKKFMLNDVTNNVLVVTVDEGKTWSVIPVTFTPSTLLHHPKVESMLLGYDAKTDLLYLSRNFGDSWENLLMGQKIQDFFWAASEYDSENSIFVTVINNNGTLDVWHSDDFFQTKHVDDTDAIEFELNEEFFFTTKKSTHKDHGPGDRDLFISYDRGPLFKAQFPPNNPTTEFYIADASLGQVFVAVSHRDNSTNLYLSEHKGHLMTLSLERVLYTNQASFDRLQWLKGTSPFVDFQAIEGLTGVFIASQLAKGQVGSRPISTVITYNKGGTWQLIQPPRYDSDGSMMECFLPNCSLHLSLTFGEVYPYARHNPLLTKENAPGLILASGNVGRSHRTTVDLFMSNDGGAEWDIVLEGQYYYQFADHGSIIVAVPKTSATDTLFYSTDDGLSWSNWTFVNDGKVMVYGLVTEPGEISSVFNVYASYVEKQEWIIITIDFHNYLGAQCQDWDFQMWSLRDELKNNECVLGTYTSYERKIPSHKCYIGVNYNRSIDHGSCPCQATDYECDWGYMRENPGDPCLRISGVTDEFFVPSTCAPGTKYNMTMGYMKIEGDACEGGEESIFKEKEVNCPDKALSGLSIDVVHGVKLGTTSQFTAVIDKDYPDDVYFKWSFGDNTTFTGKGLVGMYASHVYKRTGTFDVTLMATNGVNNEIAMDQLDVDVKIAKDGLEIKNSPSLPAVGEPVIFVMAAAAGSTDTSTDITRMRFTWYTATGPRATSLPFLVYFFDKAGTFFVTCEVSNSIGSTNFTTTIVVSDLKVTTLDAYPIDSHKIQINWLPPTNKAGLVSSYSLHYNEADTKDTEHTIALDTAASTYRLKDLKPNTNYEFVIVSVSRGGQQSISNKITAATLPDNERAAPSDLELSKSGDSVTVKWSMKGGSPNKFRVEYFITNKPNQESFELAPKGSDKSIVLSDLTSGMQYTIRVVAIYNEGQDDYEAYSEAKDITIDANEPSPVEHVSAFAANSTSVVISWRRPSSPVSGYNVYNATDQTLVTTTTQVLYVANNLVPYTAYSFYVASYLSDKEGAKSDLVSATTSAGVPGPVGSPKCYLTNSGKDVELRWNAPAAPNGPIVEYRVMYDGEDIGGELTVPGTATSTPISGLTMWQKYNVFITSVGTGGLYSDPANFTCSITPGIPGPPLRVHVTDLSMGDMTVEWAQPIIGSDVTGYNIKLEWSTASKRTLSTVESTTDLSYKLKGLAPSTAYTITVFAMAGATSGLKSDSITAATLSPQFGSIEYQVKFKTKDFKKYVTSEVEFTQQLKEEIVSITSVSRDRIDGVDSAHNDTEDVHVTFWLSPRIDMGNPSTEAAIISLDKAVVAGQFKIGDLVAVSGSMEAQVSAGETHHDIAEIIIPCVCGIIVVCLIVGVLYYRNMYHRLQRTARFSSHYNSNVDDVHLIECADDDEGISGGGLQVGELALQDDGNTPPQNRRTRFFNRFQYSAVDQNVVDDDDDDEEHLLPL